jgi:hypothetical protein
VPARAKLAAAAAGGIIAFKAEVSLNVQASPVKTLIEAARRRRLLVVTVEQLSIAFALVFAGVILLLLLGTQILNGYWLLLLAAVGIGITALRVRARLLGLYRIAQFLDSRLALQDSLSTAWFLLSQPGGTERPNARFQLEHAERLALGVDPAGAFPLKGQRLWALAGGIGAVAFGLFALRYLVTDSLSLRQAFIPARLVEVFEHVNNPLSAKREQPANPSGKERRDAATPQNDAKTAEQDHLQTEQLKALSAESVDAAKIPTPSSEGHSSDHPEDGKSDNRSDNPDAARTPGRNQTGEKNGPQNGEQSGPTPNSGQPQAAEQKNASQEAASVMDRMKDALSSMLAKMRPNPNGQKSQPQSQRSSEEKKSGDQAAGSKDQNSDAQKDSRAQQSNQEQSSEGQAQGQTTEKAQASQGRNSSPSADKNSADAHSGVGKQDGDKSVSEKEQLKAMGKLAEIIGKRSADLTGDIMVENPSGKQQLKTAYSQRMGSHTDLGGEINRDEIPLADQQYVREYMEEVRKTTKK